MTNTTAIKIDATKTPVSSVTIFRFGRAEIVRTFDLTLQAGENDVEIRKLPTSLEIDSVRVSGLGQAVRLVDIASKIEADPFSNESDAAHALRVKINNLKETKTIHQQEIDMYLHYGNDLSAAHLSTTQLGPFLEEFRNVRKGILATMNDLDEQIRDAERALAKESQKERAAAIDGQVNLRLMAVNACNFRLRLTYFVNNASWNPIYEVHANSRDNNPSSPIRLHYRAHISQNTGEDWSNTSLILSTNTQSGLSLGIPRLPKYKIQQDRPVVYSHRSRAPAPPPGARAAPIAMMAKAAVPEERAYSTSYMPATESVEVYESGDTTSLSEGTTVVQSNPLSTTFTVEGHVNIPSDAATHTVSIAALDFDAEHTRIAIPRLDSAVFIQCTVKNTSDYQLIPGPVSIFVDDSYVSKTDIKEVAPGETFECALGVDNNVRITHERKWVTHEETPISVFSGDPRKTIVYTARTIIQNKHQFALPSLVVKDGLPVSEDNKAAKVSLVKPAGLADARDKTVDLTAKTKVKWSKVENGKGGEKEGKYEWIVQLDAGEEVTLEAEWNVRVPHDSGEWKEVSA